MREDAQWILLLADIPAIERIVEDRVPTLQSVG